MRESGFSPSFHGRKRTTIERGKVLRSTGLTAGEDPHTRKILQGLVICDEIDRVQRELEVMWPFLDGFKDDEELVIMGVVVQLRSIVRSTGKCYR